MDPAPEHGRPEPPVPPRRIDWGIGPVPPAVALAVLVAALGYFVDIFDLLLFAMLRKTSLQEILAPQLATLHPAVQDQLLKDWGIWLDNILQTSGLLVGGLVWGILGDRRGRLSVLFGSILTYSVANILNAFITDIPTGSPLGFLHALGLGTATRQYEVLRFVAGFGLAGELGAGITLVSELVSREKRGFATTIVATVGILGAVAAYFVTTFVGWRTAFFIGGLLGLALLALRVGVVESGMFVNLKEERASGRGAFWRLFWPPGRLRRYLSIILVAVPIWFVVGTLVKYSDVIGTSLGLPDDQKPHPARAIMWCYLGLAAGDLASGLLSQLLRSRRLAIVVFLVITGLGGAAYFTLGGWGVGWFYASVTVLGFGAGYWAVFATTAAESFGTDLRATAATTAPNIVRWSAAWTALLWTSLEGFFGQEGPGPWHAAATAGVIVLGVGFLGVLGMRETYGISLEYLESDDAKPVRA
jgi:MFS family permease